ncbi:MAG: hypothetical protein M1827_001023 [Pycnora praestabilis]|nr:MAG: hypothetical protein M1827_001023 [Pycnora praestabilis]
MTWKQIEATAPHLTYLTLSSFLILYALFSQFIRNRLHLSEPPLALLVGIIFGPRGAGIIDPRSWGFEDNMYAHSFSTTSIQTNRLIPSTQEAARVIVGVQVFAVGVELPKHYFNRHWKSVGMMLGPVMAFGWVICSLFTYFIFKTSVPTALIIGACLTPTDPVLAASVLSNSQFSTRIPGRLRHMLSAESGCNDGVSFPFLYVGLAWVTEATAAGSVKEWFLITILWQCAFGILLGLIIGVSANRLLRYAAGKKYIADSSFFVFYFLLAIFSVGVGSTLGSDDFLVAFCAGVGFANDGWFSSKTKETHLPNVLDLLLNSSMFVYFGAIIPWSRFVSRTVTPDITPSRLLAFLALVLLFRRIPIVLALKRWIPDIRTYREALFCGHFGPMGLGALFLVIEARAELENGTSLPLPHPPRKHPNKVAIEEIWPIICFIVMGSTLVHGLSVAIISLGSHFSRHREERAPLLGGETDPLHGMIHEGGGGESEPDISDDED